MRDTSDGEDAPYEPKLDTAVWLAVRSFVISAVEDSAGRTPYAPVTLNVAASRLAAWSWQSAGLPLERPIVFHRENIARFVAVGMKEWKPASRGNIRSQLLRMSEVLLGQNSSLRTLGTLRPSDPAAPYTPKELVALRNWASAQTTQSRRDNAAVLLALGVGAGLSASEIGELRIEDIAVDDTGVSIRVRGERTREVPVRHEWDFPLREKVQTRPPENYAFREQHVTNYPNLISSFVVRSGYMKVRPTSQRLRATWIVRHLNAGVPVKVLMRSAGVESLEAFTRYLKFVDDVPAQAGREWLRR